MSKKTIKRLFHIPYTIQNGNEATICSFVAVEGNCLEIREYPVDSDIYYALFRDGRTLKFKNPLCVEYITHPIALDFNLKKKDCSIT